MTFLEIVKDGRKKKHKYRCDVCQIEFLTYKRHYAPKSGKDCCSTKCRDIEWSRSRRITLICEVCGKSFIRRQCHKLARVCGVKCRSKILPQTSKNVAKWSKVTCAVCGKEMEKLTKDVGVHSFCSKLCRSNGMAKFSMTHNWKSRLAKGIKRGFYTSKSGERFKYDSSYELRRMKELDYVEQDVESWQRCKDAIPYVSLDGETHHYNPDFLVTMHDGSQIIEETKGKITDVDVIKIAAGKQFALQRGLQYRIIQYDSSSKPMLPKLCVYENEFGRFVRPSEETIFMNMAMMLAERSTCIRKKVAAVFTDQRMRRVLCFGYNGNVAGGPNGCDSLVPGSCGCIHAEINALTKNVDTLEGATCFVTLSPCLTCAKVLINRGIKKVVFFERYRNYAGINLLKLHNVEVIKFDDLQEEVDITPCANEHTRP